jgi:hypothetical protein
MVIARRGTIAQTNTRNISALLRELQRPHRTLLLRQQLSNLRRLPRFLHQSLLLPHLLVNARERPKETGQARAKARRANIDKYRLVWHEFLHQPLVTLT